MTTAPPVPPAPDPTTRRTRTSGLFRAFWRWHFYSAFLVVPVLLMLAATGLIYLFRFQLEPMLHADLMTVDVPSGDALKVKVRAQTADRVWGDFSTETDVMPAAPVLVLPAPSAPVLSSDLGTVADTFDGLLGGTTPPAGFKHVIDEILDGGVWAPVGQPMVSAGNASVIAGLAVGASVQVRRCYPHHRTASGQ